MRWTVGRKLGAGFFSVLLIMLVVGGVSYWSLIQLSSASNAQADALDDVNRIGKLAVGARALQEIPTDYLAGGNQENRREFAEGLKKVVMMIDEHRAEAVSASEKAGWAVVEKDLAGLKQAAGAALSLENPVGHPQVPALLKAIDVAAEKVEQSVDAITKMVDEESEESRKSLKRLESRVQSLIVILMGAAVLLGTVVAIVITRGVVRPINLVNAQLKELAAGEGDLTKQLQVASRDEVGDLAGTFNSFLGTMRGMLRQVRDSSAVVASSAEQLNATTEQVAQAAQGVAQAVSQVAQGASVQSKSVAQSTQVVEQLRAAISQIAAGAQEQARNAQETSDVVGQMASAINDVASKARNVLESSREANESAQNGEQVVEKTISGMERIRASVLGSAGRIRELGQLSTQIGEITQVITDIADQTNLLALNAAIEAARAGEHGKGFAVVAEEVRKLAERSSKSAKEIAALIRSIQDGTSEAVRAMEQGTLEVEAGSRLAGEAGRALQTILGSVERTMQDVGLITAAAEQIAASSCEVVREVDSVAAITEENTASTEQMAAGSDEVTRSIEGIAAISEENAAASEEVSASVEEMNASTEEIASSARSLAATAQDLQSRIGRFKL